MTTVNISVKGAQAAGVVSGVLTSGSVGAKAVFSFDESWQKLAKTAVFRANGSAQTVLLENDEAVIPWEVLQTPNVTLSIGVYGTDGENLAIPTVWADCGVIQPGTTGAMMSQSSLPLWAQMHARLEAVEEVANRAETDPTVPGWAKEETPPSAQSVGAIPTPAAAEPGQTIVVKAVDENGKPTQWEAADKPNGQFVKLVDYTTTEDTNEVAISVCDDGESMSEKAITEIYARVIVAANPALTALQRITVLFGDLHPMFGFLAVPDSLGSTPRTFDVNLRAVGYYFALARHSGDKYVHSMPYMSGSNELARKIIPRFRFYNYDYVIPAGTRIIIWGRN